MNRCLAALVFLLCLSFTSLLDAAEPPGIIHHQGRIAVENVNFDGSGVFKFALVSAGKLVSVDPEIWSYQTYWSHDGTSADGGEPTSAIRLPVAQGLYSVGLGDLNITNMTEEIPVSVFENSGVFLRVWFDDGKHGFQQLGPDQRLTSVGYALQAARLPDRAVDTAMLANDAVTSAKLADSSVRAEHIAEGAIQPIHLDEGADAAFRTFLVAVEDMGLVDSVHSPLPLDELVPVVASDGTTPQFELKIAGVAFGNIVGFVATEGISETLACVVVVEAPGPAREAATWLGDDGELAFYRNGRTTQFAGEITGVHRSSDNGATYRYAVRLESPLAQLKRSRGYGIDQEQTIPNVISERVLNATGILIEEDLVGSHPSHPCTIQYRETEFDFVSRLMETESLFFYWDPMAEEIILGDSPVSYRSAPYPSVPYYGNAPSPPVAGIEYLRSLHQATREETRTSTVRTYDFRTPATDYTDSTVGTSLGGETFVFQPLVPPEPIHSATALQRVEETARFTSFGTSNAADLRPGHTFDIADLSGTGVGGDHVVTRTHHVGFVNDAGVLLYANHLAVMPDAVAFQPARRTPVPQADICTAVVTGAAGQEVWTDEYGRVKVQFRWDREGAMDQNSSCWIRVTQPMAGAHGEGFFWLPEVGDEVLVGFLQGHPHHPVILGSLYNASRMPPYALPDNKTRTALRTADGAGPIHELRFEDKAGEEELYLKGRKDMVLETGNNLNVSAGNNAVVAVDGSLTEQIGTDRTTTTGGQIDLTSGTALNASAGTNIDLSAANRATLSGNVEVALASNFDVSIAAANNVNIDGNLRINGAAYSPAPSDNQLLKAWGRVTATGTVAAGSGISGVTRVSPGVYSITLKTTFASASHLNPVGTPEIDGTPRSSADFRFLNVDQINTTTFRVYIMSGGGSLVDNDFTFLVSGR